jgi:hypothetical protein
MIRGSSWLSSEESYSRIQQIFQNKNFVFIRGDLFKSETTKKVAEILQQKGLFLDTLYLSNLREYAEVQNRLDSFRSAVKELQVICDENTYLVDTRPRCDPLHTCSPLTQRMRRGFYNASMEDVLPASPIKPKE